MSGPHTEEVGNSESSYDFLFHGNPFVSAMARLGFSAFDAGNHRILCNELWQSMGCTTVDAKKQRLLEMCHPEDTEKLERLFKDMQSGTDDISQEIVRIRTTEGRWVWIRHRGMTVPGAERGKPGLYIGLDIDLTEFKETEDRLRSLTAQAELHAREMDTLFKAASIITSSLDVTEAVKLILEQAKVVIPYDKASVQIIQSGGLELIGGNGFEDLSAVIGLRFPYPAQGSMSTLAIEEKRIVVCKDVSKDFPGFIMAEQGNPTRSWMGIPLVAHGDVFGLLSFNHAEQDFFSTRHVLLASAFAVHVAVALENARLYEKTYKLAMEDALMGIGSRYHFNNQGALMYENARRKKSSLSLAMVDLDHFKAINDTFGHDTGDFVLKEIGRLCRQDYRVTDLVARYGGEEIVFLFPETDIKTAVMIVERLRQLIGGSDFGPVGKAVTISAGIASVIPDQHGSLSDLLKCADSALYSAKNNGRNRTESYGSA
jgi:diguanylate cyclase (GGDEF)-like protein/PAS domain S-box-containing protein